MDHGVNPFNDWASVVDCGDISNTPFDKLQAIHELEAGWKKIGSRKPQHEEKGKHVRLISIGGDHTISKMTCVSLSNLFSSPIKVLRTIHSAPGPSSITTHVGEGCSPAF